MNIFFVSPSHVTNRRHVTVKMFHNKWEIPTCQTVFALGSFQQGLLVIFLCYRKPTIK